MRGWGGDGLKRCRCGFFEQRCQLQPALFQGCHFVGQGFEFAARVGHFCRRHGRGQQNFQVAFLGFDAGHALLVLFQFALEWSGLRGQLLAFVGIEFALLGTAQAGHGGGGVR